LGLSLSYDIIKAHGAEINVETKEDDGAELIVQLPMTGSVKITEPGCEKVKKLKTLKKNLLCQSQG